MPDHFFCGAHYQSEDGTYLPVPKFLRLCVAWLRAFMIIRENQFNPVCNWTDITHADWDWDASFRCSQVRKQYESAQKQFRLDLQKHQALNAAASSSIKASVAVFHGRETVVVSPGIQAFNVDSSSPAVDPSDSSSPAVDSSVDSSVGSSSDRSSIASSDSSSSMGNQKTTGTSGKHDTQADSIVKVSSSSSEASGVATVDINSESFAVLFFTIATNTP